MIRTATGLRSSLKRDDLKVNWNSLVVMRLKIQEQRELNFVSRIIQCPLAIGNCPASAGLEGNLCRARRVTFRLSPERAESYGLFGEQPVHIR